VTPAAKSSLPERAVLVLTSLADGEKHGYALIKDIESFAGISLGPGTLYGALARLERDGLVEPQPAEDRRHPYAITPEGRQRLHEHLSESARLAAFGLERIAIEGT
jgi:DNA-binding PadR family transcriptional regulator